LITSLPIPYTVRPGATKFGPVKRYNLSLSVLSAIIQDESGSADFIAAKDDGGGGDNWSYKTCKAAVKIVATNKRTPNFLRARCPFCRRINSVKALKRNTSLPAHLRDNSLSLSSFKRHLKTFLFSFY